MNTHGGDATTEDHVLEWLFRHWTDPVTGRRWYRTLYASVFYSGLGLWFVLAEKSMDTSINTYWLELWGTQLNVAPTRVLISAVESADCAIATAYG